MIAVAYCLVMAALCSAYALFPKHENSIVAAGLAAFIPLTVVAVGLTTN